MKCNLCAQNVDPKLEVTARSNPPIMGEWMLHADLEVVHCGCLEGLQPPRPGWVRATKQSARVLRAARMEGMAYETGSAPGVYWAAPWADLIADSPAHDRHKISALKRIAYDAEAQTATMALLGCLEPAERAQLVEDLAPGWEATLRCPCGKTFEGAGPWQAHLTSGECPKRTTMQVKR